MENEPGTQWGERPSIQVSPITFIGRTALLDSIKQHLLKGQHVGLYGDRGIGKTAITEEVVRWLREESVLPVGVLDISCEGAEPVTLCGLDRGRWQCPSPPSHPPKSPAISAATSEADPEERERYNSQ